MGRSTDPEAHGNLNANLNDAGQRHYQGLRGVAGPGCTRSGRERRRVHRSQNSSRSVAETTAIFAAVFRPITSVTVGHRDGWAFLLGPTPMTPDVG